MSGTPARTGPPHLVNIRSSARGPRCRPSSATAALHPTLEQHRGQPSRPDRRRLARSSFANLQLRSLSSTCRSWRNTRGPFIALGCCLRSIVTRSNIRRTSLTYLSYTSQHTFVPRMVGNSVSKGLLARYGPRSLFGCIGSEPARKRLGASLNLIADGIPDTTTWTNPP